MATTSDRADRNGNTNISNDYKKRKEEDEDGDKLQSSSVDGVQGKKTTRKVNGSLPIGKTDTLSSMQSINENKKSDQTSPRSNKSSDINTNQKNDEQTIEATQQKEELGSTSLSSTSIKNNNIKQEETIIASSSLKNNEDSKNDKSISAISDTKTNGSPSKFITSHSKNDHDNDTFSIEQDDAQHLTDFQLEKARYFFNVNLDIENKDYVTWEDVEFYLLFHGTASGKEGSDSGDLEARLSRAARAFWDHVHDQVPLPDGERDSLSIDQFLDAWAGLINYVVRTNQLPPIVQDLVKLGFELYSTDEGDGEPATIQPAAFDQLFQKMNIGRPYAIMAYKYLTENGTKPLDADKIDSLVKAVITSSDDEHDSHFLLPGFFKTIANIRNHEKEKMKTSNSPLPDEELSQISNKSTPSSTPPRTPTPPGQSQPTSESSTSSSQVEQINLSSLPLFNEQQKPSEPPPSPNLQQPNSSSSPSLLEQKTDNLPPSQNQSSSTSQSKVIESPMPSISILQQENIPPTKAVIQQEDDNIRDLLRYYRIDDGDLFEVSDGSAQRLVLVHPERPLPPYIQHDRQLLKRLHPDSTNGSIVKQNGCIISHNNENSLKEGSDTTSEERTTRSEPQKRPTAPFRQEQTEENSFAANLRHIYPELNEEQRKKVKSQGTQSVRIKKKRSTEEKSTASNRSSGRYDDKRSKKDINHEEEEKIVAAILKQLAPIVEKRVSEELRRIENDETDQDEDDGFIPFPFMLAGGLPFFGGPPPPHSSRHQQQNGVSQEQQQQQANGAQGADFGGLPNGGAFIPPPLLMAMMSDLTRGVQGGDTSSFPSSSRGSGGVEGFMMFVDDNQMMGGVPGYPPRPGSRF